jgi:hypothetical protein
MKKAVVALLIVAAVLGFVGVAFAEPPTPAAKAAVSDATVETRKNSQPELPDSLGGSGHPGAAIEPIPMTEELPAAVNDETQAGPHEAGNAPVSPRPVVYLYTIPHCAPCEQAKRAISRGELDGLQIIEKQPPEWVTLCPTWHWESSPGEWMQAIGWRGPEWLLGLVRPPTSAAATPANVSAPKSAADQLWKFLPEGTRITIEPPSPIKSVLEDGTIVSYSQISGVLSRVSGNPGLKLDPPLPTVSARKFFLRFGAQILGAEYESAPGVVTIETSRGKYLLKLEEAK